jgi:hypothetical protein
MDDDDSQNHILGQPYSVSSTGGNVRVGGDGD